MKVNDPDARQRKIAIAAYLRAESRNFAPGHEVADWLAAEAEVERQTTPAAKPAAAGVAPSATAAATPKAVAKPAASAKVDVAPTPDVIATPQAGGTPKVARTTRSATASAGEAPKPTPKSRSKRPPAG